MRLIWRNRISQVMTQQDEGSFLDLPRWSQQDEGSFSDLPRWRFLKSSSGILGQIFQSSINPIHIYKRHKCMSKGEVVKSYLSTIKKVQKQNKKMRTFWGEQKWYSLKADRFDAKEIIWGVERMQSAQIRNSFITKSWDSKFRRTRISLGAEVGNERRSR